MECILCCLCSQGYEEMSLNREDYEGKKVLILGRGKLNNMTMTCNDMWQHVFHRQRWV